MLSNLIKNNSKYDNFKYIDTQVNSIFLQVHALMKLII